MTLHKFWSSTLWVHSHQGISTAMSPVKLEYRGDNDLLYALCVEASGRIAFDDHQAIFTEEQNRAFGEYLNQAVWDAHISC